MIDATVPLRATPTRVRDFLTFEHDSLLGDYRLLRELGRGGMGIVYEAEQQSLRRRVALKIMAGPSRWDVQGRERFEREARSAAQLHHTNIVPIFEVGSVDHVCFYAMQFVDGIGLDTLIQRMTGTTSLHDSSPPEAFPLPPELATTAHPEHFRTLARLALQVAEGLAHAHARGVIHRDIKPANLLLDTTGVVWITDFGLAKQVDDNLTRPGDLFGTIGYMAPERFQGSADPRSDIYSLGATLYELVTRRAAYPDVTEPAHVARLSVEPPSPSRLEPRVPRDLQTIILKAMDKDPKRRYATAQDLVDDLRLFLADEPIRARPVGALGRGMRWARRRPLLASLNAAVLALTLIVIGGSVTAAVAFRDMADSEAALRKDADAATELATQKAKAAVEANAAAQEIAVMMLGILDETDPLALSGRVFGGQGSVRAEDLKPEQVLQRTLAKLEASPQIGPKVRATLLDKIGSIYVSLGQLERGGPLLEKALALRRAEHGEDSLEAAETWHHLGLLYLTQKSFDAAEQAYGNALRIRESQLGSEHALVTITVMHLGIAKSFRSGSGEAVTLLRRAQTGFRKHPGPNSREYCLAITVHAAVLLHSGKVDEAMPLLPEAMRLLQKHEGDSGLGRAASEFLQGRLARSVGLNSQAVKHYREAIQIVQKSMGEDHFLILIGRGELASLLHNTMRDLAAAETEFEAMQRLCEKNFGATSGQTALVKMLRARVLRDMKRFTQAEELLRESSEAMRACKHDSLGRCLHIYAEVYSKQGKLAEAVSLLQESVKLRQLSGDLVWYSNAASDLAWTLAHLGRGEEAVQVLQEAALFLSQQPSPPSRAHWIAACQNAQECKLLEKLGGRDKEADLASQRAIDSLRAALKTRGTSSQEIATHAILDPLRSRPEFQQLMVEIKR